MQSQKTGICCDERDFGASFASLGDQLERFIAVSVAKNKTAHAFPFVLDLWMGCYCCQPRRIEHILPCQRAGLDQKAGKPVCNCMHVTFVISQEIIHGFQSTDVGWCHVLCDALNRKLSCRWDALTNPVTDTNFRQESSCICNTSATDSFFSRSGLWMISPYMGMRNGSQSSPSMPNNVKDLARVRTLWSENP